jgi:hypothetical protein
MGAFLYGHRKLYYIRMKWQPPQYLIRFVLKVTAPTRFELGAKTFCLSIKFMKLSTLSFDSLFFVSLVSEHYR